MDVQVYKVPPAQVEQYDYCLIFPLIASVDLPPPEPQAPRSAEIGNLSDRYHEADIVNNVENDDEENQKTEVDQANINQNEPDLQFDSFGDGEGSYMYKTYDVSIDAKDYISKIITIFGRYYIYQYDNDDVLLRYVLIRGSVTRLKSKAQQMQHKMLLDEYVIKEIMLESGKQYDIEPLYLPNNPLSSKIGPFQYIYTRYRDNPELQEYYWRPANLKHPFRNSSRIYFILKTLEESEKHGGIGMNLRKLLHDKVLTAHFPLHSLASLTNLENTWIGTCSHTSNQPLFLVKEYFGDNVGIYFTLTEHLSESFLLAAILGVIFQILILYYQDYNLVVTVAYGIFSCIWYSLTIAFWKRKEKVMSLMWGTLDLIPPPPLTDYRPEFQGVVMKSPIDGSASIEFDTTSRIMRATLSTIIWLLLICFSLAVVPGIYIAKAELRGYGFDGQTQWLASIINGVWISVSNPIYFQICLWLVNFENHRHDAKFNRSLQAKVIILWFVNSYASIYYLAFFGKYLKSLENHSTDEAVYHIRSANQLMLMDLLAINLVTIFGIRSLKTMFQLICMFFITKRRCDLADTPYDLIDPMPPPDNGLRDELGPMEPDIDYDDTYGGNSPSNQVHTQSINPASKIAKKKVQRKRLSSIYGRRTSNYQYTNEIIRPGDEHGVPTFWSSFRGSFKGSYDDPLTPVPPPPPPLIEDDDNDATDGFRDRADSRRSDRDAMVEDGVKPILNVNPNDDNNSNNNNNGPAAMIGAGTYTTTRTNYDVSYREMNRVERDYELKHWRDNIECVKLYADLLIGFGYIAIFGCLLPGISLLGVLDLYLTYKKDAFRFINVYRRCRSSLELTADIGSYFLAFNTFTAIAIATNAFLIIFTMTSFQFLTIAIRLWIFIAINGALYLFRHAVFLLFTLEPKIVEIQRLRSNFIGRKLIEQVPDEEADPTSIL